MSSVHPSYTSNATISELENTSALLLDQPAVCDRIIIEQGSQTDQCFTDVSSSDSAVVLENIKLDIEILQSRVESLQSLENITQICSIKIHSSHFEQI